MDTITIYTDGAWDRRLAIGGWAAVLACEGKAWKKSGGGRATTNNRMELQAVIEALVGASTEMRITVVSDSEYVVKGFNTWRHKWMRNGWLDYKKKPVKNQDLWMKLIEAAVGIDLKLEWVRGHNGDPVNELCDALATGEIRRIRAGAGSNGKNGDFERAQWQSLNPEELARVAVALGNQ